MFSSEKLYIAEEEMREWHAKATPRSRLAYRRQGVPSKGSWWSGMMARLRASHQEVPAQSRPLMSSSVATREGLALLRAVARGEISPEVAQRLLMRIS